MKRTLSKSSLVALVALGCSGSSPPEPTAASNQAPAPTPEKPAPPEPEVATSKACIPTGIYKVDIDLKPAKYKVSGGTMSLEFCKAQLAAAVPGYFGKMAIRHHEGAVQVAWPGLRETRADGCTIEIPEAEGVTRFSFVDEAAEGIAAFVMTVPNHNETCSATGATIRLTLVERH